MTKVIAACAALLFSITAFAADVQKTYVDEAKDWGVAPTKELRTNDYDAPTPLTVPGATTVTTEVFAAMMEHDPPVPLLFDCLDGIPGKVRKVIPGATWLGSAAGDGYVFAAEMNRFAKMLEKETGGDKDREMVFYCLSSKCWLSYNAALKAVELGYRRVYWYRGGLAAWHASGRIFVRADPYTW